MKEPLKMLKNQVYYYIKVTYVIKNCKINKEKIIYNEFYDKNKK